MGDPLNDLPNGEIITPNATPGFATPEITEFFDPNWAFGWGKKLTNWVFSGSVQHELTPGVSVDVGYFRRRYVNFSTVEDRSTSAEDWDQYTIIVPEDPVLPNGGGFPITLVDLNPAALAVPDNITRSADPFGGKSETWRGVDVNFSARLEGVLLQGGYATGRETQDRCAVEAALPETINDSQLRGDNLVPLEFCSTDTPWISQASVHGVYTLPYDIQIAGSFISRQGPERAAIITVPFCTSRGGARAPAHGNPTRSQRRHAGDRLRGPSQSIRPPHREDPHLWRHGESAGKLGHSQPVQRERGRERGIRDRKPPAARWAATGPTVQGGLPIQLLAEGAHVEHLLFHVRA